MQEFNLGENMNNETTQNMTRRDFHRGMAAGALGLASASVGDRAAESSFQLNYILSSAMYGKMSLETILPEVKKTGASAIDIWCLPHGDQREQLDKMGREKFAAMLKEHGVQLGVLTRYPLGPFRLQDEMKACKQLGGKVVLCGTTRPSEPKGAEAKKAVKGFLEKMKPHVAKAEEVGVTIAVENHDKQLLYHPDSLRYFAEFNKSKHLGVAFAPHHLHKFVSEIPKLIEDLGADNLPFMYGQEHSEGIRKKSPKEIEMQQMPGFGSLDYKPILAALRKVKFKGFFEIFMHPVPRGIPILPTAKEITAAINKSRSYLEQCLKASA